MGKEAADSEDIKRRISCEEMIYNSCGSMLCLKLVDDEIEMPIENPRPGWEWYVLFDHIFFPFASHGDSFLNNDNNL